MLESFRGGLNSFVYLNLPEEVREQIADVKVQCTNCNRQYYNADVINEAHGVRIEAYMPKDGFCDDCGNHEFEPVLEADEREFEREEREVPKEEEGKEPKEEMMKADEEVLAFYNHLGLLVDFELKNGFDSYENLKR